MYKALGMMSGTSLDGVDVALIETDGREIVHDMPDGCVFLPYGDDVKTAVRAVFGKEDTADNDVIKAAGLVTDYYVKALEKFFDETSYTPEDIDIIGAHGQTITHRPEKGFTLQIGDPQVLADKFGVKVVFDLRMNDMAHGGQGAPLLPVYHWALMQEHMEEGGVVVVNLGGVGNVTYVPEDGDMSQLVAFDTGPANAYMDDVMKEREGLSFDKDGERAKKGRIQQDVVATYLMDEYFYKKPPKSLDRGDFDYLLDEVKGLSSMDALATLAACAIAGVENAIDHMPRRPGHIYVCGGGAQNKWLFKELVNEIGVKFKLPVTKMSDLGLQTDFIEAQGFAYLAVRSLHELPLTYKGTTGVQGGSVSGGKIYSPLLGVAA